ncbi:hypothetical protein J6W34_07145 [bacterium]|nr:hypothetical protein [bacterium]
MIRNIYFKCETCGNVETRFMDDVYKDNVKLTCEHCGGTSFQETDKLETTPIKLNNRVRDNRAIDKEKYMSQEYKDIRSEINRVHKEKRGLLGDKRKFA